MQIMTKSKWQDLLQQQERHCSSCPSMQHSESYAIHVCLAQRGFLTLSAWIECVYCSEEAFWSSDKWTGNQIVLFCCKLNLDIVTFWAFKDTSLAGFWLIVMTWAQCRAGSTVFVEDILLLAWAKRRLFSIDVPVRFPTCAMTLPFFRGGESSLSLSLTAWEVHQMFVLYQDTFREGRSSAAW